MKDWSGERLETFVFNESTLEHLHRYALAAKLVAGKKVLDIACGEGYGSKILSGVAVSVTGVDVNEEVIRQAEKKYTSTGLKFVHGSVNKIPADDGSFDVIVSFETLEHTTHHEEMLQEFKRVLRVNGLLIISTPDKKTYSDDTGYRNPHHVKELYAEEFRSLINAAFAHVMYLRQSFVQGSLITGSDDHNGFETAGGDFSGIRWNALPKTFFHIAIASDGPLPAMPASVFYNEDITRKIRVSEQQVIKKSMTYRVGNLILWPFKLMLSLVKK